jgi:hypothetical protein
VQQKAMRHADIRTTMNTYGDVVTDETGTGKQQSGSPGVEWQGNGREGSLSN